MTIIELDEVRFDLPPRSVEMPSISLAAYFRMFSPGPAWSELLDWPPDVFAFANVVLTHTEAYRFAVAPPPGRRWPPAPGWNQLVSGAADEWRTMAASPLGGAPFVVRDLWAVVERHIRVPLDEVRHGADPEVWEALLTLHAIADEACAGLTTARPADCDRKSGTRSFEEQAWQLLAQHGSLSRVSTARIRVTPKTHSAHRGISIRSFSRYLALSHHSVDIEWRRVEQEIRSSRLQHECRQYNILLAPWPLSITADAFRPIRTSVDNIQHDTFGFFEFDPATMVDLEALENLVRNAQRNVRQVDTLVFPEGAVEVSEIEPIERLLERRGVISWFAGVRERAGDDGFGRNYVHVGINTGNGWLHFQQSKHHRWSLDARQISQYHLSHSLAPSKQWWEAIDLPPRTVQVFDLGAGATLAPLVCEDLARMDEVADMLRGIGPSLVVALLLDGPQIRSRWPGRYASVLADEPGSAVLTLSSYGMVARSRPPGRARSRVVAMWTDPTTGMHELSLDPGSAGILLTAAVDTETTWTADGRRHSNGTPRLWLSAEHQVRA